MPTFTSDQSPIHPYRVAYEINEFLTDDTIYIGDGGDVVTISAQAVRPRSPGHWMDPGALGSLGVGTGFSIAAKLAHPKKEVLCYYGDGAFGMTAFDMETADRFGAPYIAVIGNNSAMNQIRYGQLAKYGPQRGNVGNKLGDMEFSHFAKIWGGHGEEVREAAADCPRAAPGPRIRVGARQVRRSEHLGRSKRIRPRHQGADDVQIALVGLTKRGVAVSPDAVRAQMEHAGTRPAMTKMRPRRNGARSKTPQRGRGEIGPWRD